MNNLGTGTYEEWQITYYVLLGAISAIGLAIGHLIYLTVRRPK